MSRIVARMRGLLPEDWQGRPGERFRRTLTDISKFAKEHRVQPNDLAEDAVALGRMKVEGLAAKEYATALRDFKEVEEKEISIQLQARSLGSRVRREEAEARLAELKALDAEIDLLSKLKEAGVVLRYDDGGNLTALPAPSGCDLSELRLPKPGDQDQ
jgi:predicted ArsR family transcriptional regulator